MDTHDQHSSFIKTPQQLVVVILAAFAVPIFGIVLLVNLVLSRPGADPGALTSEAVAARIRPVARLEIGPPAAAPGARSGDAIVQATCATCHQAGVAKAPKLGERNEWAPAIKQGLNAMVQSVIKGKGAMPPKAGDPSLTEDEIRRAVVQMANLAGAGFKVPATPKEKPVAEKSADGKAVYDKVCFACHQVSIAGSPKLGDKAAWAPRIQTGTAALVQTVIKGKGAMPPKAGNPALAEGEIRAAVEFMVSQSK